MTAYPDDRYEDINYANDIYDTGPAEWITESGAYLDSLDSNVDSDELDCDREDDDDDYYPDDRYDDINYANDIYDTGPAEWITESGA